MKMKPMSRVTPPTLFLIFALFSGQAFGEVSHMSGSHQKCWDHDDDGFTDEFCGGTDCDDSDPHINPCDPEVPRDCGDGIDQDCTGVNESLEEILGAPFGDNDLDCGGSGEIEPNDDIESGIVHNLGTLSEGILTVYGDLDSVSLDPPFYTGDHDYYQFEMPMEGSIFIQMMFDCFSDYDLYLLAYFDPDGLNTVYELGWYIIASDACLYVPEIVGVGLVGGGGWEFPLPLAVLAVGYDGPPGYYYLEIYYDSACLDADGDGYAGPRDLSFDPLFGFGGTCYDDCLDTNPAVNPGAKEGPPGSPTCSDDLDNDCDGLVDSTDTLDCLGTPPCEARIVPISRSPLLFLLVPAFALIIPALRSLGKKKEGPRYRPGPMRSIYKMG